MHMYHINPPLFTLQTCITSVRRCLRYKQALFIFLCRTRTETYADNKWFHLCAVQDYKTFKMYHNGIQVQQSIYIDSAMPIYGHNEMYIGDSPTVSNEKWSFIGSMAHLNIWDKALSSGTISSIGGNTYIGNLLGWPDLIKYAVPGSINVRRPSPLMKWSGMFDDSDDGSDDSDDGDCSYGDGSDDEW